MSLMLTSSAFGEGATIPSLYTCDGDDVSPPLQWQGAPPRTRSFVLVCSDPDAPAGTWQHWAVYDLPSSVCQLDEGAAPEACAPGCRQAINDFGRCGYGGPCPPKRHAPHHYRFHLMALDVATLGLPEKAPIRDVEKAAAAHILAEAVLTGTYGRSRKD